MFLASLLVINLFSSNKFVVLFLAPKSKLFSNVFFLERFFFFFTILNYFSASFHFDPDYFFGSLSKSAEILTSSEAFSCSDSYFSSSLTGDIFYFWAPYDP